MKSVYGPEGFLIENAPFRPFTGTQRKKVCISKVFQHHDMLFRIVRHHLGDRYAHLLEKTAISA